MMTVKGCTGDVWRKALAIVAGQGTKVSPRGMPCREVTGMCLEIINPWANLIAEPARKLNYYFMLAEMTWMMLGQNDVASVASFNRQVGNYSDDEVTFAGAYGPRLVEQLPQVIRTLQEDPDSRQAVLTLWRENPGPSKDVPCTVMMHFMIRRHGLEAITYMRSNDLWLGTPYDLFNFTTIQRAVAHALHVNVGTYRHVVGSMHLYETNLDAVARLRAHPRGTPKLSPMVTWPPPPKVRDWFNGLATMDAFYLYPPNIQGIQDTIRFDLADDYGWQKIMLTLLGRHHDRMEKLPEPFRTLIEHCGLRPKTDYPYQHGGLGLERS